MSDVSTTASAMTGAGGGNKVRLLGMQTGLDVDATVKKMLTGEQSKLDKAKQQQQTIQWKQEAYQDIIKDVKALQSTFFDPNSSDNYILGSKNFAPFSVTSTSGAATVDTSVATFTPGVGSKTGRYSITVAHLAEGAGVTNTLTGTNLSTKLTALGLTKGSVQLELGSGDRTANITLNNADGSSTLGDLVNAINNQGAGVVKASFSELSGVFKLNTADTGTSTSLTIKGGTTSGLVNILGNSSAFPTAPSDSGTTSSDITLAAGAVLSNAVALNAPLSSITGDSSVTLKLNAGGSDINVTLSSSQTVADLINAVSSASNGNATASYDSTNGVISLKSNTATSTLKIEAGTTNGVVSKLFGMATNDGTALSGKNADVTITDPSGATVHFTDAPGGDQPGKSSNDFSIDGMNYILSSTGTASVNVGSDTSKVYDKINDFVTKYNVIIDKIQGRISEKKDKNYPPLTDSQKSSMSETQITAWENKAKMGIVRNDDNLQNMLNDLRSAFNASVANTGLSFGQYGSTAIGIDFSNDPLKPGHIEIANPSKLKAAIANYPDQISKMFTNVSSKTDGSVKYTSDTNEYKEDGIFKRVKSIIDKNVGFVNTTLNTATLTIYANKQYDFSLTGTGGNGTIPDQLYEQQLAVKKITTEMSTLQERYYKQFSALETAMTRLNAQQSQLSSMLGN